MFSAIVQAIHAEGETDGSQAERRQTPKHQKAGKDISPGKACHVASNSTSAIQQLVKS